MTLGYGGGAGTSTPQLVPYQPTFARLLPAVALGGLEDEEQEAEEGGRRGQVLEDPGEALAGAWRGRRFADDGDQEACNL
jgi:hypothetical protein